MSNSFIGDDDSKAGGIDKEELAFRLIKSDQIELDPDHVYLISNETGAIIDMGPVDEEAVHMVVEEEQSPLSPSFPSSTLPAPRDTLYYTHHPANIKSLIDLINSEPAVNNALALRSELVTAYGYTFSSPTLSSGGGGGADGASDNERASNNERASSVSRAVDGRLPAARPKGLPEPVPVEVWEQWAEYVNLDHIIRQTAHSLLLTGNAWIEKVYDTPLNRGGWGVRKLRVLSPDTMYNVVNEKGQLMGFIQSDEDTMRNILFDLKPRSSPSKDNGDLPPPSFLAYSPSLPAIARNEGAVWIDRHRIVYINYNAYYDNTPYGFGAVVPLIRYAKSKIGVQRRALRIIENHATSFVVFKYGSPERAVTGNKAARFLSQLKAGTYPKYVALPWYFEVDTVQLEGNLPALHEYMQYFREEELTGVGLPPVLTGRGGSSEGAQIQLEILVRQTRYLQNVIGNEFRRQLFPEVLFGDPTKSRRILTSDPSKYPYIRPSVFIHLIPSLKWFPIESVADMRLRHDVYAKHGLMSTDEIRKELGYSSPLDAQQLPPLVAMQEKLTRAQIRAASVKTASSSSK